MDRQITMMTRDGLQALGALLRGWAMDPDAAPGRPSADGRRRVMATGDLVKALAGKGVLAGEDYALSDALAEVELVLRRPEVLTLTLPDAEALKAQAARRAAGEPAHATVADFYYTDSVKFYAGAPVPAPEGKPAALRQRMLLSGDPFAEFLDEHMAAYSVSQCL
jgi:hypothetical protein